MPHSLRSAPSYSSSSETRRPMTILITKKAIAEVTKTQPKIVNAPMICPEKLAPSLVTGTSSRPQQTDYAVHGNRTDRIVDLQLIECGDGEDD